MQSLQTGWLVGLRQCWQTFISMSLEECDEGEFDDSDDDERGEGHAYRGDEYIGGDSHRFRLWLFRFGFVPIPVD
jgi:hypothetical protein